MSLKMKRRFELRIKLRKLHIVIKVSNYNVCILQQLGKFHQFLHRCIDNGIDLVAIQEYRGKRKNRSLHIMKHRTIQEQDTSNIPQ